MAPNGQPRSQDSSPGLSVVWLRLSLEGLGGDGENGGVSGEVLGEGGLEMSPPLPSSVCLCVSLDPFTPVFVLSLFDSVPLSLSCVFDPLQQNPGLGVGMWVTWEPLASPSPSVISRGC